MEFMEHDVDNGYHMAVYLCLGQPIHSVSANTALNIEKFATFDDIHQYMSENRRVFIRLGKGIHKIKKKAEQIACEEALRVLQPY